ncbi:hypothetical protein GCM10009848_65810 [Micromonospora lupini]
MQLGLDRRERRRGRDGNDAGHARCVVDPASIGVQARVADLPDTTLPVPGSAFMDPDLRRSVSPSHPTRAKPVIFRPTRMPARARLPTTTNTGLPRPPTARAAPETLPFSRSSASKNLTFKSSKPTIPATP